jgi:endoglucanase
MNCYAVVLMMLGSMAAHGSAHAQEALKVGDVVFQADFEGEDALKGWIGGPGLAPGYESDHAIAFANPPEGGRPVIGQLVLPAEPWRGYLIHLACMVKAEDVSAKPQPWNGIKFMLPIVHEGGKMYPQADIPVGTFDWRPAAFDVRVPPTASDVRLYMGLEGVTGKVWFDDLKITIRRLPFVPPPAVTTGEPYKGHDVPRLRGAMISPNIDEAGLRTFGEEWNANVIRWQLVGWRPDANSTLEGYDGWLEEQLRKLDAALPLCEKYGLYVVVDLHSPPTGPKDSGESLFTDPECQAHFIDVWRMMARRYREAKVVWGYDLVNEPIDRAVPDGCLYWQELSEKAARAVREIDPEHAIIIECPEGDNPFGFVDFAPIDVPHVVYSVHMYLPHTFTHQGVYGQYTKQWLYPGEIDGRLWDKAQIERALQPAIDFAERYRVHMYVGEFSAIRWAPDNSAYRYLRDCIEVFEAHGWDWTYHAFREWNGWSVEHGPDKNDNNPSPTETDREKLLREWYAKNEKPKW